MLSIFAQISVRKSLFFCFSMMLLGCSPLFAGPHPQPYAPVAKVDPATILKACFREAVTVADKEYTYKDQKYKIGTIKFTVSNKVAGYMFDSAQFAPDVEGYGGTFNLLVTVDESGKLLDFAVKSHHETPGYLKKVMVRKKEMIGKNIFTGATGFKGDAVTGATYTSKGLATVLNQSGRLCAAVLQKTTAEDKSVSKETVQAPPGNARDIDGKVYKQRIEDKQLSSQVALYWKSAE